MERNRRPEQPIFVVGASRSGTTLMRSVLNRAPSVFLSAETHYFDDLRERYRRTCDSPLPPEDRTICEDYFLALAHRPYGHGGDPAQSALPRDELRAEADELGGSADAHFVAYCRLMARQQDADRWGEKTPRHVFRLPEILDRFEGAKAIVMVRDPRAVVASYRDWQNRGGFDLERDPGHRDTLALEQERTRKSYNALIASLLWKSGVVAGTQARERWGDERVRLVRYEDLVQSPSDTIRRVTDWLGIEFSDDLLEVPMHNSSVSEFDSQAGVSTAPLERWRSTLSDVEVGLVQSACGQVMTRVGYEPLPVRVAPWMAAWHWATLPVAIGRAFVWNRGRMGRAGRYILRRARTLLPSAG